MAPPEDVVVHGFRVFSAEPNYYCLEGACAALMTEIAFVKVNANNSHVLIVLACQRGDLPVHALVVTL